MGSLVGALPTHPRQNIVPGLPLLLMPEETTLLVEEGHNLSCLEHVVTLTPCLDNPLHMGWLVHFLPLLTLIADHKT